MSPKLRVENVLHKAIIPAEFLKAATYIESLGFLVNERSPDAVIRAVAKAVKEFGQNSI